MGQTQRRVDDLPPLCRPPLLRGARSETKERGTCRSCRFGARSDTQQHLSQTAWWGASSAEGVGQTPKGIGPRFRADPLNSPPTVFAGESRGGRVPSIKKSVIIECSYPYVTAADCFDGRSAAGKRRASRVPRTAISVMSLIRA